MPLFSCIIPAYNMEQYIERCVCSLTQQHFSDIEILIIDDGSSDATLSLAYQLAEQHDCIRVFHQENAGQGAARNRGLREACGEYIWFVDADDWVEDGSLLHYAKVAKAHNPDVIYANLVRYSAEKGYVPDLIFGDLVGKTVCPRELPQETLWALAGWRMHPVRLLSRRMMLEDAGASFSCGLYYEDHPFGLQVLHAADRLYVDALPTYVYYQRTGSTIHIQHSRIFDFIQIRQHCLLLLQGWGWDKLFPIFFLSYLLPTPFYEHHVPKVFRKEFLRALRPELTAGSLRCVQTELNDNLQALGLLWSIRLQLPVCYILYTRLLPFFLLQSIRSYCQAVSRKLFRVAKQFAKKIFAMLRGKTTQQLARLCDCHDSVNMTQCNIDVRVTNCNAPYIYAEEGASLNGNFVFERGLGMMRFGRRCSIGGGSTLICSQADGIHIGEQVMVSWGCTLTDTNAHSLDAEERCNDEWYWRMGSQAGCPGLLKDWTGIKSAPIVIEDRAWIGFNSIILGGVTVGRGAVVGAGSVVSKNIPPYTVFTGNPARFVKLAPRREAWSKKDLDVARQAGATQDVLEAIDRQMTGVSRTQSVEAKNV